VFYLDEPIIYGGHCSLYDQIEGLDSMIIYKNVFYQKHHAKQLVHQFIAALYELFNETVRGYSMKANYRFE